MPRKPKELRGAETKISDLNAELETQKQKSKKSGAEANTLTEETELTIRTKKGLLEGSSKLKRLLETKKAKLEITTIAALYTDDNDSDSSIAKVKKHLDEYKRFLVTIRQA